MLEEVQHIEGQILRRIAHGTTLPANRLIEELVSDKPGCAIPRVMHLILA